MIKNYFNFLNESMASKSNLLNRILRFEPNFIIYRLGMRNVIDKIKNGLSVAKDYNSSYQVPLSILSKTGKFDDIKGVGGSFHTDKISNMSFMVDSNGKWHPSNKLNTNYTALSTLLVDVIEYCNVPMDTLLKMNNIDLRNWLISFTSSNDIYSIILNNFNIMDDKYINIIRSSSRYGEIAEDKVANIIRGKGLEVLYQGGDGDVIDMIYGCDLIVANGDKIYLVQVKSKPENAKKAFDGTNYSNVDWFCAPVGDTMIVYTKGNPTGKLIK